MNQVWCGGGRRVRGGGVDCEQRPIGRTVPCKGSHERRSAIDVRCDCAYTCLRCVWLHRRAAINFYLRGPTLQQTELALKPP